MAMKKNLVIYFFLVGAVVACKKNSGGPSAMALLEAHQWYPYQVQVTIDDTLTARPRDTFSGAFGAPVVTTRHFDTLIVMEPCLQRSVYTYAAANALHINNACTVSGTDGTWSLSQANFLQTQTIESSIV